MLYMLYMYLNNIIRNWYQNSEKSSWRNNLHFFLGLPKLAPPPHPLHAICRIQLFLYDFYNLWKLSKKNTMMIEIMQIMMFTIMKFVPKTTLLQPSLFKFQLLCICCAGILHFYHYVFVIFVSLVARYSLFGCSVTSPRELEQQRAEQQGGGKTWSSWQIQRQIHKIHRQMHKRHRQIPI